MVDGFCITATAIVLAGYMTANPDGVILGAILTSMGAASMYVVFGSLILQWAKGLQPATDYALLYGLLGRFVATIALMVLPGVIQIIGWPAFRLALMAAFAIAMWYLLMLFPRSCSQVLPTSFYNSSTNSTILPYPQSHLNTLWHSHCPSFHNGQNMTILLHKKQ